jgi:hypothetical protein
MLPDIQAGESVVVQQLREISAAWIEKMVQQPQGVLAQPLVVSNAIITGNLKLQYVDFRCDVRIERCRFKGTVDLSFSAFSKAAVFDGDTFEQEVLLNGVRTQGDFECTGADFQSDLEFQDAAIARNLCAQGTRFQTCNFEGASIGGQALFKDEESNAPHFGGEATFDLLQIEGGLELQLAQFDSDASFIAATVKHYANLTDVVFRAKARFDGAAILGDAIFERAQFTPSTAALAKCNRHGGEWQMPLVLHLLQLRGNRPGFTERPCMDGRVVDAVESRKDAQNTFVFDDCLGRPPGSNWSVPEPVGRLARL